MSAGTRIQVPRSAREGGVTLIEMMIALVIVAVGVLGLIGAFNVVQRGIQMAKNKTLASNLAQEQMQIIEQETYFSVVPTMNPLYLSDGTPYDDSTFPPETVTEGGNTFNRYTYVQVVAENNGILTVEPPTTPDTGMRQITVDVEWQEDGATQKLFINSVMSNPDSVEANCVFMGNVYDATTGSPIQGALVSVAENLAWFNSTDSQGAYSINLSPGSYNLVASAKGYFSQYLAESVASNDTDSVSFHLPEMSSGTVTGAAWVSANPVISQVVVSSVQSNGYDVEYVELFNATPSTYTLSAGGPINLNLVSGNNNLQCVNIPLNYVNDVLYPDEYYLIANTTTFTVDGTVYTADAYFSDEAGASCNTVPAGWNPPSELDLLQENHSDTIYVTDASGDVLDAAGWTDGGTTHDPSYCEGTCISQPSGGLPAGDQIVRTSSPSWADGTSTYGRAYDSGNNSVDFAYPGASGALNISGIPYPPFTTASPAQIVIAGAPAAGAVVSASDGLSSPTTAYLTGNPPIAQFVLPDVATGTWSVYVTSGLYEFDGSTVVIAASDSVYTFPSSTTILDQTATAGFIGGQVVNGYGQPISAPSTIEVSPNGDGSSVYASAGSGSYFLRVSTGNVNVTVNPNFANPDYVSVSSLAVSVGLGEITGGVDFVLSQGGRLSGFVTRDGINGLEGVTVYAIDSDGNTQDQETTNSYGDFTTINMATGTYSIEVPLDTTESASPTSISADVSLGQTVFAGTFTITGALGTISGNVTLDGSPISTGVLIVVATGTLPSGPPSISSASLTSGAYYAASSLEDGTYSVQVRQSTSPAYNVYGYYAMISSTGAVTIESKSLAGVAVLQGQTVSGKNLSW